MKLKSLFTAGILAGAANTPVFAQACPGDVDSDGQVNLYDLSTLLAGFGTCAGAVGFDARADLDRNNCVDLPDLATLLANYGATCSPIGAVLNGSTLVVTGNEGDNVIVVSRDAAGNLLVNGGSVSIANGPATVTNTTLIRIWGRGGADELRIDDAAGAMPPAELFGEAGDDDIFGGSVIDVLNGGPGDDSLDGRRGNDTLLGGDDNDTMIWNPGDGSDTLEGQAGLDTMLFVGSNASEIVNVAPNGGRVTFTRDVATITMDLNDVEAIEFRALGGADNISVGDMTGTDLTEVTLDLRGPAGSGDDAADSITVNATQTADVLGASGSAGSATFFGLHTSVDILFAEPANDRLTLNALGGDDVIDAADLTADTMPLTINGGLGNDVMIGSQGVDVMFGGDGNDTALMGGGDDTFVWNPGDDNDTIEGQAGFDTMLFNGANVSEIVNVFANGGRALFTRNVANVIMDCNDVERMSFNALGGSDQITVNDLSGTDVTEVQLDVANPAGSGTGDGAADTVTVIGTNAADVIVAAGDAAGSSVFGLAAQVNISGAEAANDRLVINGLAGDDTIECSGLLAGAIALTANGGDNDDVLVGGDGNDTLLGGNGDDVLVGGPGTDVLDGGPGDNVIIQ